MSDPYVIETDPDSWDVVVEQAQGPAGAAGPNSVTAATATTLTGLLYGDGTRVTRVAPPPDDGAAYALTHTYIAGVPAVAWTAAAPGTALTLAGVTLTLGGEILTLGA